MLTEQFINSCLSVLLSKSTEGKSIQSVCRDILEVTTFYKKKEKGEIPIVIKNKLECLEKICELRNEDISPENVLDSISEGEKFKHLIDFLETKMQEENTEQQISDNIEQIKLRKKSTLVFSNYDELSGYLESVKNGSYNSLNELVTEYEKFVKGMYGNLMNIKRTDEVEMSSTFNLATDNYTSIIELIKKKYSRESTFPTGFDLFDNGVLNGGYERSRLYIYGGGSGSGKSTLMTNCIERGMIKVCNDKDKGKGICLYITLENQVDETFMRIYQSMFMKTGADLLRDIVQKPSLDIKSEVLAKFGTDMHIVFKYYPKYSITPIDVSMIIDEVEASDKDGRKVQILYLDYLDLLRADAVFGKNYDLYRLELSHITSALKDIAVAYNIPIITVSQLGREVYTKNPNSKELNLGMMSESIKKVEHADFIALMSKDQTSDDLVHMNIAKNRGGRANISIDFTVNFAMYKFLNGSEVVNKEKPNAIQDHLMLFGDLPGSNAF